MHSGLYVCSWIGIVVALIGASTACTAPPDAPPQLTGMPVTVSAEATLDLRPKWPRSEFRLEIKKEDTRYFNRSHSSVSDRIVADVKIEPRFDGYSNVSWTFGTPDLTTRSGYSRGVFFGYAYYGEGSDAGLGNTNLQIQLDTNGMPKPTIEVETRARERPLLFFPSALSSGPASRDKVYARAPHPFLFLGLSGSSVSGGAAHPFQSTWKGWPPIWEDSMILLEEFDRERNTATITVQRLKDPESLREQAMKMWKDEAGSHGYILRPKDEILRLNFQTRATYEIDLTTGLPDHVVFEDIITLDGKLDRFFRMEFRVLGPKRWHRER